MVSGKLGLTGNEPTGERKGRAPCCANLAILSLLQDPLSPRQGLTSSAIVAKTKLSFSSVKAALEQGEENGLIQQAENFWLRKMELSSAPEKRVCRQWSSGLDDFRAVSQRPSAEGSTGPFGVAGALLPCEKKNQVLSIETIVVSIF